MAKRPPIVPTAFIPMTGAGVYMIHSRDMSDRYIGSAKSLAKRYAGHLAQHRLCGHTYAVETAIKLHKRLFFTVLEICDPSDLLVRERAYVELHKPNLNCCPVNRVAQSLPLVDLEARLFAREFQKHREAHASRNLKAAV